MIHVDYVRVGLLVVAIVVNDNHEVKTAVGFTQEHATKRLFKEGWTK